jgi:hypothetical protein
MFSRCEYYKAINSFQFQAFAFPPLPSNIIACLHLLYTYCKKKQTPWPESTSELYRPNDRRLLTKLVPTCADRGCHVVSVKDPYGRIPGFLDRSRYFFFQVAPELYSRGWMDPAPDILLLRKSGSAENRTRTSGSVARNSGHQTTEVCKLFQLQLPFRSPKHSKGKMHRWELSD